MKTLSILATTVVAASLLAGATNAYAISGGFDYRGQAVQIEQAVAAAQGRATSVATKDANGATTTK